MVYLTREWACSIAIFHYHLDVHGDIHQGNLGPPYRVIYNGEFQETTPGLRYIQVL